MAIVNGYLWTFICTCTFLVAGCAQNQETTAQNKQAQVTPSNQQSTQASAQDGPRGAIVNTSNPHGLAHYDADGYLDQTPDGLAGDLPPASQPDQAGGPPMVEIAMRVPVGRVYDYSIRGNTNTNNVTGNNGGSQGQTPSQTPSVAATGTATATGGEMTQKPEASVPVMLTVSAAPGSSAQGGTQSAGAGEGTFNPSNTTSQSATNTANQIKAMQDQIAEILKRLPAAGVPTSQPAIPVIPAPPSG